MTPEERIALGADPWAENAIANLRAGRTELTAAEWAVGKTNDEIRKEIDAGLRLYRIGGERKWYTRSETLNELLNVRIRRERELAGNMERGDS